MTSQEKLAIKCLIISSYLQLITFKVRKMQQIKLYDTQNPINQSKRFQSPMKTSLEFMQEKKNDSTIGSSNLQSQNFWTKSQLNLLQEQYFMQGPCWKQLKTYFSNKSQDDLKNRINNSVRKLAIRLSYLEKNSKKQTMSQLILAMLKLCFEVEKYVVSRNLTFNKDSVFCQLKSNIIRFCFQQCLIDSELEELLRFTKILNKRLKCFGVFKVKNLKYWVLSENGFKAILLFDKPFVEQAPMSSSFCLSVPEKDTNVNAENNAFEKESSMTDNVQNLELDFINFDEENNCRVRGRCSNENLELQFCRMMGTQYNSQYALITDIFDAL